MTAQPPHTMSEKKVAAYGRVKCFPKFERDCESTISRTFSGSIISEGKKIQQLLNAAREIYDVKS